MTTKAPTNNFHLLLKARGLSIPEFARRAGISEAQARNLIAGRQRPRVDRALRIARLLRVQVEDLWPEAA